MLATVLTVGVYVICISTGIFLIVELYRYVKRKLTKEPEPETSPTHLNVIDWSDSKEPPKRQM